MAQPASGKPSLIDSTPSAGEGIASIRMLDALDANERPPGSVAQRRGFVWPLAALLLIVAAGASWSWWSRSSHADDMADRMAQAVNVTSSSAALPALPAPSAPASAAGTVAEPASAATIVATADSALPPLVETAMAASAPASPASEPAADATATAAPASPAKAKPTAPTPARAAAPPNADRKQAARASAPNRAATPNSDPDVALLSAMLATMSRDARANADSTPSPQTQLTIAQLVQRCEQRGVKDAIETFECKRRICDGYWGKADACPKSLSPKKN